MKKNEEVPVCLNFEVIKKKYFQFSLSHVLIKFTSEIKELTCCMKYIVR